MRLIDADALDMFERLNSYYGDAWRDAQKEIDEAPTVEAIPIEWIETDIEASAFSGYDIHAYEVTTMLEEWKEKEGKKNEQTAD